MLRTKQAGVFIQLGEKQRGFLVDPLVILRINLTPKAFANSSLGQRPRETHLEISRTLKAFANVNLRQRFQRFGDSSLTIPGALPQVRIGERLRRKFVNDLSSI
jgi:hypothetical protein